MRNKNWAMRLGEYIKNNANTPFTWGRYDCCLFVADCCVEVCGVDPAESYRGTYKTELGAKRAIKKNHGTLENAFDSYFKRRELSHVQRGDICTFMNEEGKAAAVFFAGDWWSTTEGGVKRVECDPIVAWEVVA